MLANGAGGREAEVISVCDVALGWGSVLLVRRPRDRYKGGQRCETRVCHGNAVRRQELLVVEFTV